MHISATSRMTTPISTYSKYAEVGVATTTQTGKGVVTAGMDRLRRSCGGSQRRCSLLGGTILLLIVDVIWVGSAGLSRYIFVNEEYNKPLFVTYFKTSLFSIYLVAFIFWRPWQRLCASGQGREGGRREGGGGWSHYCPTTSSRQSNQPDRDSCSVNGAESGVNEQTGQLELPKTVEQERKHEKGGEGGRGGGGGGGGGRGEGEGVGEERGGEVECEGGGEGGRGGGECGGGRGGGEGEGEEVCCEGGTGGEDGDRCAIEIDEAKRIKGLSTCALYSSCSLGPSFYKPLKAADSDKEDDARSESAVPPCRNRCSRVRFNRTIEIRQFEGERSSITSSYDSLEPKDCSSIIPSSSAPLNVSAVSLLALVFGVLWFFANYLYSAALSVTSVAAVNTVSSLSGIFVLCLTAIPFLQNSDSDRFSLSKLVIICMSVLGAVMIGLNPASDQKPYNAGLLLAVGGAVLYALYLVLLNRVARTPDRLEIPMFFGFVGLFDAIVLLPVVVMWNYTGIEFFEWPPSSKDWTLLLVNGFLGTVLSELLWLWGVFLTSPLLGTLNLTLVIPFSIGYSLYFDHEASFTWLFFVGAVFIVVAFIGVFLLDYYGPQDPLWTACKKLFASARDFRSHSGFKSLSCESQQLLHNQHHQSCTEEYSPS